MAASKIDGNNYRFEATTRIPSTGDIVLIYYPDADIPKLPAMVVSEPDSNGAFKLIVFNWAYTKEGGTTKAVQYVYNYGKSWEFKSGRA